MPKKKIVLDFKAQMKKKMDKTERDITYQDIADETHLSQRTIWRLYKGQAGRMKLIETLCDYFDCDPGDLLKRV